MRYAKHYGETHQWNDVEDRKIIQMARDGYSMREIAIKMSHPNTNFHVTRLSVLGRLSRLKFKNPNQLSKGQKISKGREYSKSLPKAERKIQISKPQPFLMPNDDASQAYISAVQAKDIHCAWIIIGEPRNLRRCSSLAVSGCSWCALHAQHVFADLKPVHSNAQVSV